jgi:competence ComEA-like helix-hairpin-helix protein
MPASEQIPVPASTPPIPSASDQGLIPARVQPLLAAVIAASLTGIAVWFFAVGGHRGGLVHHDAAPPATVRFTVNINAASTHELAQLPGLGPTMAARLVEHRRDHGPFTSIDGLLDVPGIGPATLDQLRPHLRPIRMPEPAP